MAIDTSTRLCPSNQIVTYQGDNQLIIGIILSVITFWLFAQAILNIAPDIQKDVTIVSESLNFSISLTALISGCFMVAFGGLADRWGRVKTTYVGLILSVIGSACLLLAKEDILFITGRIIQGFSAACIMPATLAIVRAFFDGAQRQRALSFLSIGSWGGSGACSIFGGAVATYMGWHWIYIFSIICAFLAMYLLRKIPETKIDDKDTGKKMPFDYSGLFFFVTGLVALKLIITKGSFFGWFSITVLALAITFIACLIIFYNIEIKKQTAAFIDFALFKNIPYTSTVISNFLLNAVSGTILIANTYNQIGRGFNPFQAGLLSLGYLVMVLIMIRVGEKILQKVGAKKPMLVGTFITAIGIGLMSLTFLSNTTYIIAVFVGFVLFGLGLGLYATPSVDTAISNVPVDKAGVASGIFKMTSTLGNAFGMAITTSIFTMLYKTAGYSIAFGAAVGLWMSIGFCLLSFISILILVPNNAGK